MKQRLTSLIAICAFAGLAAPALADCQQELAELRDEVQSDQAQSTESDGISKDGSRAPLESDTGDTGTATDTVANSSGTETGSGNAGGDTEIVKDGSQAPLNTDLDNRATSGQNAEARQEDDGASDSDTAAQDATSTEVQDALARAEEALEAGDEAACMDAVEAARTL